PPSVPPRLLHPPPPRRSSDLAAPMQHTNQHGDHAAMSKAPACAADSICAAEPGLCELVCMGSSAMLWPAPAPSGVTAPQKSYRRDRKSTRLNSSHVSISYAVF